MTRNLTDAEKLLGEVAIFAPDKPNKYVREARIPWDIIQRIRKHLDDKQINWREIRREMHRIDQARRREKEAAQ